MHRRQLLTVAGLALTGGIAGCSSPQQEAAGLTIQMLELENRLHHDAVFDVTVMDANEETVFETEQVVEGGSAVALDRPTDQPGQFTIQLMTGGHALTQNVTTFAEAGDSCVVVVGRLDRAERLRIEGTGYDDCST